MRACALIIKSELLQALNSEDGALDGLKTELLQTFDSEDGVWTDGAPLIS